jgi:hypothetical protein
MIYNITPITIGSKVSIQDYIKGHMEIINNTHPEAIGVYDIIDEPSTKERVFPLRQYMNTYEFCKELAKHTNHSKIIVYRSVKPGETYHHVILDIIAHQHLFNRVVIVGNSANPNINTHTLISMVKKGCSVNIGCVLIPERPNEIEIVKKRIQLGVVFFITQIIVDISIITPILETIPKEIKVWCTLVPINNVKTLKMVEWLRVNIDSVDLETYPKGLIANKDLLIDYCFESISKISNADMISFIKRFIQ